MRFIGKYQTHEVLGSGSMACVYRAEDPLLDREVALKVLHANLDAEAKERFYREARVATKLRHPNIAVVWDLNESEGRTYIAMELLRGEDLRRCIENKRPVPLALKLELVAQVCDGLAAAHRKGVVHGDVRPSHIFIHEERTAKLLDFGMAQWPAKPSDIKRDVLSVGAVLYEFAGADGPGARVEKVLGAAVEGQIGTAENLAGALRGLAQDLRNDISRDPGGSRRLFGSVTGRGGMAPTYQRLQASFYRFGGMLLYGVAQKKIAKYCRDRAKEVRQTVSRLKQNGPDNWIRIRSWLAQKTTPALSRLLQGRASRSAALASFTVVLALGLATARIARKPPPAEKAVATATVQAALADLHEGRSGAGKILDTLAKGTRVKLLERWPLGEPAFIRAQVVSPRGNSRPGYIAMRDLGDWASADPSVAWDLIRLMRPAGDVDEGHQRQFLSELETYAARFNGTPQAEQARLQEIGMLFAMVEVSQKAGKPRFEWQPDLDQARNVLSAGDPSSASDAAFAHLQYRLEALESPETPVVPKLPKREIAQQDNSPRELHPPAPPRGSRTVVSAVSPPTNPSPVSLRSGNSIALAPAPSPPPPTPPKPVAARQGQLSVVCRPVDCDVWTNRTSNRKYIGTTVRGELSTSLPEGPIKISATKTDYEPDHEEETVAIDPERPARVEFRLSVSRVSLDLEGRTLFRRMIQALGEEDGLREAGAVRGSGFIEVYGRDGHSSRWPAPEILIRPAGESRVAIRRAGETFELIGAGPGFSWTKPAPKAPELAELEEEIPLVTEYQLGRVMEQLDGNGLSVTATGLETRNGEAGEFRAQGRADTYVVTLDPAYRPKEIRIESAGVHSGLRISFSAYENQGRTSYPRTTQVLQPGALRRGVFVSFEKLELNLSAAKDASPDTKKKGGFRFFK